MTSSHKFIQITETFAMEIIGVLRATGIEEYHEVADELSNQMEEQQNDRTADSSNP